MAVCLLVSYTSHPSNFQKNSKYYYNTFSTPVPLRLALNTLLRTPHIAACIYARYCTKINGRMTFRITQQMKQKPRWDRLIRLDRKRLKMSQPEWGSMFGVTYAAVSDWERGINDPPGAVTWYLYQLELKRWKK